MPLYGYHCKECNEGFERLDSIDKSSEPADCPKCGKPATRVPSMVRRDPWKPIFLEHVSLEGKHFESKRDLRNYLSKTNQTAPGLVD